MYTPLEKIINRYIKDPDEFKSSYAEFINVINSSFENNEKDRKLLENALDICAKEVNKTNQELQAVLKAIPDIFFHIDTNGKIKNCNGGRAEDLFIERSKLIGNNLFGIPEEHVSERFRNAVDITIVTNEMSDFNYYWNFGDRKEYYKAQIIYLDEKTLLVTIKNISELQHAIHKLQSSEEELKGFLKAIPDSILTTDIDGNVLNIISHSVDNDNKPLALPKEDDIKKIISETIKTHTSQVFEYEVMIDDVKHWVESRTAIIRHQIKKNADIIWLLRDVSERKRAYEQTEKLLSSISSILIGVDENDVVTRWNESAENTFGISQENAIDKNLIDLDIKWNWADILLRIGEAKSKKTYSLLDDIPYEANDGKERMFSITVNPISTESMGKGYLLLISDTTQNREIEMQLRQAQKLEAIGQLAAGVAHEINTPLQYINDNTHFLKDSFADTYEVIKYVRETFLEGNDELNDLFEKNDMEFLEEEIPESIESALSGISKVIEIVKSLKTFSHMDTGEKSLVDINDCLKNTIVVSKNEWKYVAELETEYEESLPQVMGLHGELNQVFLNIIVNAAHAISDSGKNSGGKITVRSYQDDDNVIVSIADNGCGMPDKVKEKVFDPFFTTKEVGRGTGQGLAISYNVIKEKHGGHLEIETKVDEGTTFFIYLPK